jgi:hypothetical protein
VTAIKLLPNRATPAVIYGRRAPCMTISSFEVPPSLGPPSNSGNLKFTCG